VKLSIVMPSIRTRNIQRVINSIDYDDYELIIVSPDDLREYQTEKIITVQDWGSPNRAMQIGLDLARGDIVTNMADDATYNTGQINKVLQYLKNDNNEKLIVTCKYTENDPNNTFPLEYFLLKNAYPIPKYQPYHDDWFIFNMIFLRNHYMKYLGGLDCNLETLAFGFTDLAVRAYLDNAKVVFHPENVIHCDWLPPGTIEHWPVELSHTTNDTQYFINKNFEIQLDINNWKDSPSMWSKRFNV
jgi:glycosyltransferase involved in cell wall biosynthesis